MVTLGAFSTARTPVRWSRKCEWWRVGVLGVCTDMAVCLYVVQTQFEMCMKTGDRCHLDWLDPANPLAFQGGEECRQGSIAPFYVR